jgi:hypothetical protein
MSALIAARRASPFWPWLGLLGRVDPSKADLVLLPIAVEQRDRVAVSDSHHPALDNFTPDGEARDGEKDKELRSA